MIYAHLNKLEIGHLNRQNINLFILVIIFKVVAVNELKPLFQAVKLLVVTRTQAGSVHFNQRNDLFLERQLQLPVHRKTATLHANGEVNHTAPCMSAACIYLILNKPQSDCLCVRVCVC